ncbi:hypothetical protein MBH78_22990 [Oceanimonas sp. NS1]|nr:hypothetical protein [Oceanimonas sp. NS1]
MVHTAGRHSASSPSATWYATLPGTRGNAHRELASRPPAVRGPTDTLLHAGTC